MLIVVLGDTIKTVKNLNSSTYPATPEKGIHAVLFEKDAGMSELNLPSCRWVMLSIL